MFLCRVDLLIPGVEKVGGFSMCSGPGLLQREGVIELAVKYSKHPPAHWVHTMVRSPITHMIFHKEKERWQNILVSVFAHPVWLFKGLEDYIAGMSVRDALKPYEGVSVIRDAEREWGCREMVL